MARDTQFSFPQAGLQPADGIDCGAYTANEYKAMYIAYMRSGGMIRTGAGLPGLPATPPYPDVGVFYAVPDRLAVTSSGAALISIATGAYICDGAFGYADTAIVDTAVTIPAGLANSRIDRVVIRQNYTAADYTSVNVPALVVPANTARLCVISGAEAVGPAAPTLTQDQDRLTYWDIPLYQYEIIHTTGVISDEVDQRDWVDAEIKRTWIPPLIGYNSTGAAELDLAVFIAGNPPTRGPFILLADATLSLAYGRSVVPDDFISGLTTTGVLLTAADGDAYVTNEARLGACSASFASHLDFTGYSAIAVTSNTILTLNCIQELSATSAAKDDFITATFYRDGTDVLDTIGDSMYFLGWDIEYLGWGRK